MLFRFNVKKTPALPPEELLYRVGLSRDKDEFLRIGKRCAEDIAAALEKNGRPIDTFRSILDFGCGCGRTIRWFDDLDRFSRAPATTARSVWSLLSRAWRGSAKLCGCDIDGEAIAWCSEHLGFARFARNAHEPPSPFPDAAFDLIYSVSVFSHLREDYDALWGAELARIARPGGIVLLTLHGEASFGGAGADGAARAREHGFAFVSDPTWKDTFPEWYGASFYTEAGARRRFAEHFEVVDYLPLGLAGGQDMIVLRKPVSG